MKFTFTEKNIQTSDALREYAERKIGKLDKFFRDESDAYVTFSVQKGGRQIAEVTLRNNGMYYRVSEATGDMYASIDSAVASIERQIRKNKTRLEKRLREGALTARETPDVIAPEETEEEFRIVRTKRFSIKPMSPEEAILQMNLLDHEWFVFKNQDNDEKVAIVYKRKSGGYGLIEDEN